MNMSDFGKKYTTRQGIKATSSAKEEWSGSTPSAQGALGKAKMVRGRSVAVLFEKYADRKTGKIVVTRLIDGTGFTKKNLAGTLGISVDAMYRPGRVNAPATQMRMREMLEILGRITDWAGGEVQAMAWYRAQPIPAFGGRTAESSQSVLDGGGGGV